jgi:3-oxoacyl-[acyl-carrier-protein] synthase III
MFKSVPLQSQAAITAIGAYLPLSILNNDELSQLVDTNDEWIVQRTGIHDACAGFVSALLTANGLILTGLHRKILMK